MRTGPVALAYLDDPAGLVEAAMAVSALTHHQDLAQEACAVWCLMIRHAVLHGELPTYDDIAAWVPNAEQWRELLHEAESQAAVRLRTQRLGGRCPAGGVVGDHPHAGSRRGAGRAATSSTRSPPRSASATTPTRSPRSPAPCSAPGGG